MLFLLGEILGGRSVHVEEGQGDMRQPLMPLGLESHEMDLLILLRRAAS